MTGMIGSLAADRRLRLSSVGALVPFQLIGAISVSSAFEDSRKASAQAFGTLSWHGTSPSEKLLPVAADLGQDADLPGPKKRRHFTLPALIDFASGHTGQRARVIWGLEVADQQPVFAKKK